ncbi:hypothetical protein SNE40_013891 [Patella caerulea]|uniref:C2H2-type domain-containing protein n=1 Tax=Patella caerulea TaxID=87958 RepID=A0AAN8PGB1_PATCE
MENKIMPRVRTFIKRGDTVEIDKCSKDDCCDGMYHCPYCDKTVFKPTRSTKTIDHIQLSHFPHAVYFKDLIILKCFLTCNKSGHYHCPCCSKEILKRANFKDHLIGHLKKDNEDTGHVQAPNFKQPKKIEFSDSNDISLCELPCQKDGKKHYHCHICKTKCFVDLSSTLTHVWRCSQEPKDKPRKTIPLPINDHVLDPENITHHISVVRRIEDLPIVRCTRDNCCENKFHCVLCPADKFKPNFQNHLKDHYTTHWKNRVEIDGYNSLICYCSSLPVSTNNTINNRQHFHCPFCGITRRHKIAMEVHVDGCSGRGNIDKTIITSNKDQMVDAEKIVDAANIVDSEIIVSEKLVDPSVVVTNKTVDSSVVVSEKMVDELKVDIDSRDMFVSEDMVESELNDVEMVDPTAKTEAVEDITENDTKSMNEENGIAVIDKGGESLLDIHDSKDEQSESVHSPISEKSCSKSVEDMKLFGTLFGLIPGSIQELLGSSQEIINSCLSDIAQSTCTTLRWFSHQENRFAMLSGDFRSLDMAQKLFTSKLTEKNIKTGPDITRNSYPSNSSPEDDLIQNVVQNIIENHNQVIEEKPKEIVSKIMDQASSDMKIIKTHKKRGRPKKVSAEKPKDLSFKPFSTVIDAPNNQRYNTRGKRVKVYNSRGDDIDGYDEDVEDKDYELPLKSLNRSLENEQNKRDDNDDDDDVNDDDPIQKSSVSTMTYLSDEDEDYEDGETEETNNQSYENSNVDNEMMNSTLYIPPIKVIKPTVPIQITANEENGKCPVCDFQSEDFFILVNHTLQNHPDYPVKSLSCEICEKFFQKQLGLLRHLERIHCPQQQTVEFSCEYCVRKYKTAKLLAWHLSFTHKISTISLVCKKCDYAASSPLDLRKHKLTHRGEKECEQCGKTFKYFCLLKTHIETVHKPTANFSCEHCDKVFSHSKYLKSHLKRHTGVKPHICNICNAAFYESNTLKSHEETHLDSKDRKYRYICSYCGSKYNNKTNFEEHLNKHTGNKPHKCVHCDKAFGYKTMLSQHIRFSHSNEKPYKCEFCSKSFKVKTRLTQHLTTHTGVSRYVCESCQKAFTCSTTLKKHLLKCKLAFDVLPEEHQLVLPEIEYIEMTETNGETQTVILDTSQQSFETMYLGDVQLEQIVTEEAMEVKEPVQEEVFVCSECNMAFNSFELAQQHILTSHA